MVDAKSKEYFGDGEGHIVTVKQMESWSLFNDSMSVMAKKSAEKNKDQPDKSELQSVFNVGGKLFYIYTVAKRRFVLMSSAAKWAWNKAAWSLQNYCFSKGDLARTEPKETLGIRVLAGTIPDSLQVIRWF